MHSRLWGERVWIRVLQMGSVCLLSMGGEEIGAAQEEGPVAGSAWRGVFGLPPVAGPERPSMRAGDELLCTGMGAV